MKVSILTTVYNRERHLEDSVESSLKNGFDDFECILVDDCSDDDSWEVCQRLGQKDSRIRSYRNDQNLGDYPNRNRAAALANGRYLKYVDSDDLLLQGTLRRFVDAMERHPEAAYAITSTEDRLLYPNETVDRALFEYKRAIGGAPGNLLIRRRHFEEVGGFATHPCTGDYELQTKLASKHPILLVKSDFVEVRTLDVNQSALHLQSMQTRKKVHELTLSYASEAGDFNPEVRQLVMGQAKTLLAREIAKELCFCRLRNFQQLSRNFRMLTGHGMLKSLMSRKRRKLDYK